MTEQKRNKSIALIVIASILCASCEEKPKVPTPPFASTASPVAVVSDSVSYVNNYGQMVTVVVEEDVNGGLSNLSEVERWFIQNKDCRVISIAAIGHGFQGRSNKYLIVYDKQSK